MIKLKKKDITEKDLRLKDLEERVSDLEHFVRRLTSYHYYPTPEDPLAFLWKDVPKFKKKAFRDLNDNKEGARKEPQ